VRGKQKGELGGLLRRYKAYPDYKASGVEWLGEIPVHWAVSRISEMTTLLNGYPFDSGFFTRGDGTPLVRIRDLNATEPEVSYIGPIVENAWIEPGDVIVGMDGEFNVARWRGRRALLNQRLCCLRPLGGTDAGFISYLLPLPLRVINDLTYSTTVKHLSSLDVRKIRLGAPPESEQRAIAAFLDRETARMDELVAKKERLIELLQEQRTALITRAVTKGLDPSVPMKNSGVEWLGQIPAHWDTMPLKRAVDPARPVTYGIVQCGPDYPDGIRYIRPVDMTDEGGVHVDALQRAAPEIAAAYTRSTVRAGDIVVSIGPSFGKAMIVPPVLDGANLTQGTARVAPRRDIDPRFLFWALRSDSARMAWDSHCSGATFRALTLEILETCEIVVPALAQQRAIAAFLDRETTQIDTLIDKIREAIVRLMELRTALISAAVTGKIDVREEAA
jgi:type I restriction enzyme, S subunit